MPMGSILLNRSHGVHRSVPVDPSHGFSITYALLMSWLFALVSKCIAKIMRSFTKNMYLKIPHDSRNLHASPEDIFLNDEENYSRSNQNSKSGRHFVFFFIAFPPTYR